MRRPARTSKQKEIMGLILRAVSEGRFMTTTELHAELSFGPAVSFGAIRKAVQALVDQNMLEKQRNGRNMNLVPTERGYCWFHPAPARTAGPNP